MTVLGFLSSLRRGMPAVQMDRQLRRPSYADPKAGFTVVELLVVLGVIAILCALVLPAVQHAREAARQVQCTNNLHQIGVALHSYQAATSTFPPGWVINTPVGHDSQNGWGWLAMLLPQMDQGPLFNSINFSLHLGNASNETARLTLVEAFLCPTDHVPAQVPFYLKGQHITTTVAGSSAAATRAGDQAVGSVMFEVAGASYLGVFGLHDPDDPPDEWGDRGEGVFSRNSAARFADLLDGASQTLVVGERSARRQAATWTGMHPQEEEGAERVVAFVDFPPNHPEAYEAEFSSRHPEGVHFLLGDGSVRFVSDHIDRAVYQALGTRAGNESVGRTEF